MRSWLLVLWLACALPGWAELPLGSYQKVMYDNFPTTLVVEKTRVVVRSAPSRTSEVRILRASDGELVCTPDLDVPPNIRGTSTFLRYASTPEPGALMLEYRCFYQPSPFRGQLYVSEQLAKQWAALPTPPLRHLDDFRQVLEGLTKLHQREPQLFRNPDYRPLLMARLGYNPRATLRAFDEYLAREPAARKLAQEWEKSISP